MRADFTDVDAGGGARIVRSQTPWGVDSEYGCLADVLLAAPDHLTPVPCCSVTINSLRRGFRHSTPEALRQHQALTRALELHGVRCHLVPPSPALPDLTFARDASLMTPWGFLELSPAAAHRRDEPAHVASIVASWGVPMLGRIDEGHVEGGDVCILRPGIVLIGCSGVRTDEAGAGALAQLFERHGWRAVTYRFDPHFLHLDTQFTMIDAHRALACTDVLDDEFIALLEGLGIELVPVTYKEVQQLGANVVSLGNRRVLASTASERINAALTRMGYDIVAVEIDQFTRCGGGMHCLTMPLARQPLAAAGVERVRTVAAGC
jgi:N-dimethylarginine dimethylaminohydrolase